MCALVVCTSRSMTMIRLILFVIVLLFAVVCWSVELRPERTKIIYTNPKYIANVTAVTQRKGRHEPYRTNLTGTLLVPYGNNVTYSLILQLKTGGDFKIVSKVCDTIKTKWMQKYMAQYTNLTLSKCPFAPGTYSYTNIEIPPRGVPVPVMDGDYFIIMQLALTASKEKILVFSTLIHFDENSPSKSNRIRKKKGTVLADVVHGS